MASPFRKYIDAWKQDWKHHPLSAMAEMVDTDLTDLFSGCKHMPNKAFEGIERWDVSRVTTMQGMFSEAMHFNQPLPWDVSNVTDMRYLFYHATSFNQPLPWDVFNVTDMHAMFHHARRFNQPLPWDVSSVTDMSYMFHSATTFNQPLYWDVSKVTNMRGMFCFAESFNQPLPWDVSNVTDMSEMFEGAVRFNQPLPWDVSNVTEMQSMFMGAKAFNQPLNVWNVANVRSMVQMFAGATAFTHSVSMWRVNDADMTNIFGEHSKKSPPRQGVQEFDSKSNSPVMQLYPENTYRWARDQALIPTGTEPHRIIHDFPRVGKLFVEERDGTYHWTFPREHMWILLTVPSNHITLYFVNSQREPFETMALDAVEDHSREVRVPGSGEASTYKVRSKVAGSRTHSSFKPAVKITAVKTTLLNIDRVRDYRPMTQRDRDILDHLLSSASEIDSSYSNGLYIYLSERYFFQTGECTHPGQLSCANFAGLFFPYIRYNEEYVTTRNVSDIYPPRTRKRARSNSRSPENIFPTDRKQK